MVALKVEYWVARMVASRDCRWAVVKVSRLVATKAAPKAGQMVVHWACIAAAKMVVWRVVLWVARWADKMEHLKVGSMVEQKVGRWEILMAEQRAGLWVNLMAVLMV